MSILKVTAIQQISILDPYPMEGVAEVTINQAPGEYKEYDILHQQAERLTPLLDRAVSAGILTYVVDPPEDGGLYSKVATLLFDSLSEFDIGSIAPANSIIKQVDVNVSLVFNGATASTLGIFIEGTPDVEIVNYTSFDLHSLTKFMIFPRYTDTIPMQLIAHYNQDGATQGSADIEVIYITP